VGFIKNSLISRLVLTLPNNQNKTFMRKTFLRNVLACSALVALLLQSCKDDSNLTTALPIPDKSFTESFDNYQEAYDRGWRSINKSSPSGREWYDIPETVNPGSPNFYVTYFPGWNQAQFSLDSTLFPNTDYPKRYWKSAYASQRASNGYVATSIACGDIIRFGSASTIYSINSWLVSPVQLIKNGDKVVFYAYSKGLSSLQLWVNSTSSLDVGDGINNTGDFRIKIVDVNPTYKTYETNPSAAFPIEWTRFEGEVKGLTAPVNGRLGFRYILQNQRPIVRSTVDPSNFDTLYTQIHKSVIGVDEFSFHSAQ
jgi:hypothetical protein